LVRGQDGALLLLDEPETHFNDVWKRELIDLIDDVILKETFAQVLVSTHTSLALTDVFKSEIVLLRKDEESGRIYEADEPTETFGATPEDILRHVFEADEIIGRRAAQILDVVLIVTALEEIAAPFWVSGEFTASTVGPLWEQARQVPHAFARVEDLARFLNGIWRWTKAQTGKAAPPLIVDTLTEIERKLGPGHYQFEFRRRILAHRRRADAAPDYRERYLRGRRSNPRALTALKIDQSWRKRSGGEVAVLPEHLDPTRRVTGHAQGLVVDGGIPVVIATVDQDEDQFE
jgi:hypothetical protein